MIYVVSLSHPQFLAENYQPRAKLATLAIARTSLVDSRLKKIFKKKKAPLIDASQLYS